VLACDLDPRALDQAARSLAAAGLAGRVELRRAALGSLPAAALAGRVLLANLPPGAHRELLGRLGAPPPAALLSGLRPAEARPVEDAYRALGLAPVARAERGGFACIALVAP
jgi:hypothetical protein